MHTSGNPGAAEFAFGALNDWTQADREVRVKGLKCRNVSVTGQRSNRTERQSAIRVIKSLSRDLEKTRHNPFAISSADKFRCCRAAKTRGVTQYDLSFRMASPLLTFGNASLFSAS